MKFSATIVALFAALTAAAPVAQENLAEAIKGRYIVTLKSGAIQTKHMEYVRDLHQRSVEKRQSGRRFRGVEKELGFGSFKGYYGHFDPSVLKELEASDDVEAIEADQIWTTSAIQNGAPYGLGQLSSTTGSSTVYRYDDRAGVGTFGYVVDTGILTTHQNFAGRASNGFNAVSGVAFADTNGHGTHVAGTMGSNTFGVAKRSSLIAVKVFSGREGTTSVILNGFNWAVNDIISKGRQNVAVINLSLGGPPSNAFDSALNNAFNSGVLSVVAAGNENQNAANVSPARAARAITVGSVDSGRRKSSFSNFGAALDVWAAGTGILSTWSTSNTATNTISGTSMAAPHVAGLVNYLQSVIPGNAAAITTQVINRSVAGVIGGGTGSPNRIANNRFA